MRQLLWTMQRDGGWMQAFLEDFGVNGVDVCLIDSTGAEVRRNRFAERRFAEEFADREHSRLQQVGWAD